MKEQAILLSKRNTPQNGYVVCEKTRTLWNIAKLAKTEAPQNIDIAENKH